MEQQSGGSKITARRKMLLQSLELSKQLTPQQRFAAFLDLQEALVQTYFDGLQSRYPDLSPDKLLEMARKERLGNEK